MQRKYILLVIIIALTMGCSSINVSPTVPISSPVSISSMTPGIITPSVSTPTTPPYTTSTNTFVSGATESCLAVVDKEVSLSSLTSGTVLIGKGYNYGHSFLDLSTDIKYEVTTQSQCAFCVRWAVSPDKHFLAGIESLQNSSGQSEKTILWVLNAWAQVMEKVTFDMAGLYDMRWLDSQNIIFHMEQTTKDGTVMIFNPFTKEQHYISNELPAFYAENYFYPNLGWLIEYSPDFEWGIYFGLTQAGELGYVIRDFRDKKTVLQIKDGSGEYQKPIWSPNGDEVAVAISGRPYLINRDGETKAILNESQQSQVERLSWSPDGRFVAFWNLNTLMLYKTQSNETFDMCLKSDSLFPLIWSPDSRWIAIPADSGDNSLLVDTQENKTYKLKAMPEIIYPMEWMNSIP